ncbi:MAG TPA: hypothetical protein VNG51_19465 [Ktedonobacteraceae bacterium]|nr:hypothetical protein [Ktedonobacteraceae bacterium]
MATYQTKDGTKIGFVPGVGEIVDGLLKDAPDNLENHNLVKVEQAQQAEQTSVQPPVQPQTQPQVSAAPAVPVASNPLQQGIPQIDPQTPKQEVSPTNPVNEEIK